MELHSPAFSHNGNIPSKHTCDGKNTSPELSWSDAPEGTQSFVLIVDDPDAVPVAGHVWDHWVLYDIPPQTTGIPENASAGTEGLTSFERTGYGGPCPPNGMHSYHFKLYALNTTLDLSPGATKGQVLAIMNGQVLAEAELIGTYNRSLANEH